MVMSIKVFLTVLITTLFMLSFSAGYETKECKKIFSSGMSLHCPPPEEPENTECCNDDQDQHEPVCCHIDTQNQSLVMIVALSVICTCFALTVLVVVCCFCPKCLLYDACRAKYTRGEIIAYTKEEEMALNSTMPYEDQTEKTSYSPQAIKIKPIADV